MMAPHLTSHPARPAKGPHFYRRKRFWMPAVVVLAVAGFAVYFLQNPIQNFRRSASFALRLWDIQEKTLQVQNGTVHVYEGGTQHAETVVLLHGFGGNALLTWMQLLPALQKHYHVVAIDLLASNFLQLDPRTYSVRSEVEWVLQTLQAMHIEKANFVGLSVGGWISALIALEYPERVEKLVLIDSAGLRMEIPTLAKLTLVDRPTARQFLDLLFYDPPPLPDFVLDQMVQTSRQIKKNYEAVFAGFIRNSEAYLLDDRLTSLVQPTLVVHGRQDRVIPLEVGERLQSGIRHARLVILEASGHAPVWDQPQRLKQVILKFLMS